MKKTNVLMIDDNVELVNMVKEYFSDNEDVSITLTAHDGVEGLKLILERENEYDVILLDLIMPKKDGMHVLKELKEKNNAFFEEMKMNREVTHYYYAIQNAWSDKDMDTLKQHLSSSLYDQWKTKLNWWEYEGIRNELSDIRLLKTMVVEVGDDYFWSYIEGKMRDRMIKGNEVTQDNKEIFIEYWRFIVEDDKIYLDEIRQEDEV